MHKLPEHVIINFFSGFQIRQSSRDTFGPLAQQTNNEKIARGHKFSLAVIHQQISR